MVKNISYCYVHRSKINFQESSFSLKKVGKEKRMENLIVEKLYFNLLSIHLAEVRLLKCSHTTWWWRKERRQSIKIDMERRKKCFQSVVIFLIVSKLNFNGFPFLLPPRFRSFYALLYFLPFFFFFFGDTNCFPFMKHWGKNVTKRKINFFLLMKF